MRGTHTCNTRARSPHRSCESVRPPPLLHAFFETKIHFAVPIRNVSFWDERRGSPQYPILVAGGGRGGGGGGCTCSNSCEKGRECSRMFEKGREGSKPFENVLDCARKFTRQSRDRSVARPVSRETGHEGETGHETGHGSCRPVTKFTRPVTRGKAVRFRFASGGR